MENLWGKIRKSVLNGVTVAAEKTEEYTKLGKAKFNILAVKRKISKQFAELGGIMYDAIKEKKAEDALKSPEVVNLINSLQELEKDITEKEGALEEQKKKSKSEEKSTKKKKT